MITDYDTLITAADHYWKFGESSAPAVDSEGGLDMTASGTVNFGQGNIMLGYSSRTSVQGIATNNNFLQTAASYTYPGGDITISFFAKASHSTAALRRLLGTNGATGQWVIYTRSGNAISFEYYQGGATRTASFSEIIPVNGTQQHFILRISGTTATMVLDGERQNMTLTGTPTGTSGQRILTSASGGETTPQYSHLSIWHSALTDAQLTQLIRAGRAVDASEDIYASASGTYLAPATPSQPISLELAGDASLLIGEGGTIRIKSGVNNLPATGWLITLQGESGSPIKIKPELGSTKARFDATNVPLGPTTDYDDLTIPAIDIRSTARYLELWNFEVFNTNTDVASNRAHHRPDGFVVGGQDIKIISPWIYDNGQGVFVQETAENLEIYGPLIFNNGEVFLTTGGQTGPGLGPRPAGHSVYAQCLSLTDRFLMKRGVMWGQFNQGFSAFGTTTTASGIDVDGVVSFNNGDWETAGVYTPTFSFQALQTMVGHTVKNSVAFRGSATFGRNGDPHKDFEITGNKFYNVKVQVDDFSEVVFSDNLLYDTDGGVWSMFYARPEDYPADPTHGYEGVNKGFWTGTGNTYAGAAWTSATKIWNENGVDDYDLSEWQALTNIDSNATIRNITSSPYTSPLISYFPNEYENGKGFIAVYNPPLSDNVTVNVSTFGMVEGQAYNIYDVVNPFGTPAYSGTYASATPTVSVPMTGTTVREPIGYSIDGNASDRTSKEFKAFMLLTTDDTNGDGIVTKRYRFHDGLVLY